MTAKVEVVDGMSVVRGIPLAEEPGIGALTLAGLIREVCDAHGPNEALVLHLDG